MQKEKDINLNNIETDEKIKRHDVKILFPTNIKERVNDKEDVLPPPVEENDVLSDEKMKRKGNAELLFMTRRKLYVVFFALMIVFTSVGACLFFRESDKAAMVWGAVLRYDGEATLRNALLLCYAEIMFALLLFALGMTAFAPLGCVGFVSYYFVRCGYHLPVCYARCLSIDSSAWRIVTLFVLTAISSFGLIYYLAEVWKFSAIASEGISNAMRKENFVPYLINLIFYLALLTTLSYFMILTL